jgi:hypothetical protein
LKRAFQIDADLISIPVSWLPDLWRRSISFPWLFRKKYRFAVYADIVGERIVIDDLSGSSGKQLYEFFKQTSVLDLDELTDLSFYIDLVIVGVSGAMALLLVVNAWQEACGE